MPERKFLDIVPPQKIKEKDLEKIKKAFEKKRFSLEKLFLIFFFIFILGILFFHFKFQKAEIKIWPKTKEIKIEREITLKEGNKIDFQSLILPAFFIEIEGEKSQNFPSSYLPKAKKAQGKIRVYNFYSTWPLTLRAQTRFLSSEGKLFRSPKKIVIPGKKKKGGKWVPGYVDVEVIAAEPGPEYNIGPSKFSLPGLAGTNLYTLVYGESFKAMQGGSLGKEYQILKEDLEKAKQILAKVTKEQNLKKLKEKAKREKKVFLPETAFHEILEVESSPALGSNVKEFNFKIKILTKGLAFLKKDLDNLAEKLIEKNLKKEEIFWPKTLSLNWEILDKDLEKKEIILNLKISAKVSQKIEKEKLKEILSGKSSREAFFLLENQFEKVEISLFPFWLKKIPKNLNKIFLEFLLDEKNFLN